MDQKTWGFFYAFFSVFKSYPSPYPNTLFNSSKSILVFFFFCVPMRSYRWDAFSLLILLCSPGARMDKLCCGKGKHTFSLKRRCQFSLFACVYICVLLVLLLLRSGVKNTLMLFFFFFLRSDSSTFSNVFWTCVQSFCFEK